MISLPSLRRREKRPWYIALAALNGVTWKPSTSVVVMRNEHSVNLSLHGRTDLVIAGEGEVPVIAGEQQRNAVVGKQRVHLHLASPACPEDVEVLGCPTMSVTHPSNRPDRQMPLNPSFSSLYLPQGAVISNRQVGATSSNCPSKLSRSPTRAGRHTPDTASSMKPGKPSITVAAVPS
jgi:hypothetical protein